ncbi:heterokaryon incompatibility protein-domain-containing protein [Lasiosphaeria ovina]|uniref:Heterokaryon incompatibility protein-domain-containing protein n=1 Tax=Lasiosphaeria ovina TaxID=92902 RepID=A0AAE0KAU9_9PEZI|nr:heterokaryon incompatibility protein-domain-containing protein [Lasiosphaeria ovina]
MTRMRLITMLKWAPPLLLFAASPWLFVSPSVSIAILMTPITLALVYFCVMPILSWVARSVAFFLLRVLPWLVLVPTYLSMTLVLPAIIYLFSFGQFVIRLPRFRNADVFDDSHLCERCQSAMRASALLCGSWFGLSKVLERNFLYGTLEEMQRSWRGCHLCVLALSLHTGGGAKFGALRVSEGRYQPPDPDVQVYMGSDQTLNMISHWIQECALHSGCQKSDTCPAFLPSRLLFLGTPESPELRVVSRSSLANVSSPRYIALSHCWGGNVGCTLTEENYSALSQSLPGGSLPKNFADAVQITRRLNESYLWIDSLCIMQDSPDDWEKESLTMGQVFAYAYCVIAATASANAHGGCLRDRPVPRKERNLMSSKTRRYFVPTNAAPVTTLFDTRVEIAPLTRRAWAFQERLLSRRLVHFCSDVVLFECNTMQASEFHQRGVKYEKEPYLVKDGKLVSWFANSVVDPILKYTGRVDHDDNDRARRGIRGALDVLQSFGPASQHSLAEKIEFSKRWFDIVAAYSEGALTVPTDKLIALSGVAELVQERAQAPYIAGLWNAGALALQLLWMVKEPVEKQALFCAPSWSWASANGRIGLATKTDIETTQLSDKDIAFESEVESVSVFYKHQSVSTTRSQIDAGSLTIKGPGAQVYLREVQSRGDGRTVYLSLTKTPSNDQEEEAPLRLARDWDYGSESDQPAESVFVAMHVMTVRIQHIAAHNSDDETQRFYGLVLRQKSTDGSEAIFERVGVFWTGHLPRSGESSDRESAWTQQRIVVE